MYANDLSDDSETVLVGELPPGTPIGGSFNNGSYYYYDSSSNSIIQVILTNDGSGWTIDDTQTIPLFGFTLTDITVTDIAISNDGSTIYLLVDNGTDVVLLSYNNGTYENTISNPTVSNATQVTVGSDGTLYVVEVDPATGEGTLKTIDPTTGNDNNSEDDDIIIVDPSRTFVGGPTL